MIRLSASRRDRALARQLPDVASELARLIDAGWSLAQALEEVARESGRPVSDDLAGVVSDTIYGVTVDDALRGWSERRHRSDVALLVAACRLGSAEGGDLVVALEGVSAALNDALELSAEASALTAQARTSATVLMVLPFMGLALFTLLDRSVTSFMFGTPSGWVLLALGCGLDGVGAVVMTLLVRWSLR